MWSISDLFPSWGDTGTKPADGTDRAGGDQISDEEYDYLWYAANQLEIDTRAALNDLDSDADGIVDKADSGAAGFSFDGAATLGGDVTDGAGNTLWNNTGKYVPEGSVEQGPNSGLDADSVDGTEPPYVPSGVITMWSGSTTNVPSGWTLCDGTDGAPNLQNRFIVGAGDSYTVDETGGEAEHTLTEGELPSHTHTYTETARSSDGGEGGGASGIEPSLSQQNTGSVGNDESHENRPPYYALAYIMKL